jgi:translation initiation factor IF-3
MARNFNRKNNNRRNEPKDKINNFIKDREIRLIGDVLLGESGDIVSTQDALNLAKDNDLDLVMVSNKSNPPVCKIVNYKKFVYEKQKKAKELEKKQKQNNKDIKEVRFTSNTDQNDVDVKTKNIEKFIEKGHKVKLSVLFKGRNVVYKERGDLILLGIAEKLSEIAKVETLDIEKVVNNRIFMTLAPKK